MSAQPILARRSDALDATGRGAGPRTIGEALPVFLSHASPRVLILGVLLAATARLQAENWSAWDLAPLVGIALYWPIQEWTIHVLVLHAKPVRWRSRTLDFRVPRKHRAHHREPWRLDLLFMPTHSFLYTIPILLAGWWLVTPTPALALTGITAHFALALHYEWVHFLVHTRVQPRSALYQRLWKNHRRHHFKNEHYWFGVTMLGGDRLLGTAPAVGDVATSPTARSLAS